MVKTAVNKGHTILWDADVSNIGFMQKQGLALALDPSSKYDKNEISPSIEEQPYDQVIRQRLFENLTTQDDHLMHITGVEKTKDGKTFFIVKNSWGDIGPYKGYIHVSEAYFAINTISLVLPKSSVDNNLLQRFALK